MAKGRKKQSEKAVSKLGKSSSHKYWGKNCNNKKTPLGVPITSASSLPTHYFGVIGLTFPTSCLTQLKQCKV